MADMKVEAQIIVKEDKKIQNKPAKNEAKQEASNLKNSTNAINQNTKAKKQNAKETERSIDALKKYIVNIKTFTNITKKAFGTVQGLVEKQSDFAENLNLLQNAFKGSTREAMNYVDTLGEVYGFDESSLTKSLGLFRQLTDAMGMTNDVANKLSYNLESMALDISSLYNVSVERSANALQSALTGRIQSIRSLTGSDITQATLQQKALALGIDESVRSMTRAEKAMLIYLTLVDQLSNAQGDMTRTINGTANQLKIFKDQCAELARNIGGLLLPIFRQVLYYLNGILMALNEVIGAILGVFGIQATDLANEFGIATSDLGDMFDDLGDSATASSAKIQKSLRSFDKLNNLSSQKGGGGVSGVSKNDLGTLNKLQELMTTYDNHLDSVKNKAVEIRDSILKTLGFHQELNEETGKWEWKYGGLGKTVKNLWSEFSKLNPKAKIFVGLITGLVTTSTLNLLKKFVSAFGDTGLGKWVKGLLSPTKQLGTNLLGIFTGKNATVVKETVNEWSKGLTIMQKLGNVLVGGGLVYTGLQLTQDGIRKIAEESNTAFGIIETGLGTLSSIIGGGLIGATFGGATGGIIGAVIGGLGAVMKAVDEVTIVTKTNLHDIEKNQKEVNALYDDWAKKIEEVNGAYRKADVESDYYQRLWKELQSIVDENGKIKKGYEDRAETISTILASALGTEIKVVNGNIEKWKELQDEIDNYIIKRKNAMKLSALENVAQDALNKLGEAQKKVTQSYDDLEKAQRNFMEGAESKSQKWYGITAQQLYDYAMGMKTAKELAQELGSTETIVEQNLKDVGRVWKNEIKAVKDAQKNYETANKTLDGYRQTIKNYETALGLSLQNNEEALDKFFDHEQYLYGKSYEDQKNYWSERKKLNEISLEELAKNRDKYSKEEYQALKKSYEDDYKLADSEMDKLTLLMNTKSGQLTDDMIKQWGEMGKNSEKEFMVKVSELPEDISKNLKSRLQEKGIELTEAMQKAFDNNKPKLNAEIGAVQSKNLSSSLNTIATNIGKTLSSKLSSLTSGNSVLSTILGSIKLKADGGFLNQGDIFIANEKGAEMVGSVGHRTAVANNDQIVESISIGVAKANMATKSSQPVIIEAKGDASGLLDFITFKQKEKNRQYGI